jgi:hypothetical protein
MGTNDLLSTEETTAAEPTRLLARVSAVAIKAAFPFIAEHDVRFYLCGVNIRPLEDGSAMVVATDGHRFLIVRDPDGYAEREVIVSVSKDAIKHADAGVTFDVLSDSSAVWNSAAGIPLFVQPGHSIIEGDFPRIESVVNVLGYSEGISGAVNTSYLADALKIKIGSKAPAIRFFSKDSDSPLLFLLSGIGEIEVIGGIMKMRETLEWLPRWMPAPGEFKLQQEAA